MATPLTPSQLLEILKAEGLTVKEYSGWRDRCRCHDGSHEKGIGRNSRGWGQVNGTVVHITAGNLGGRTVQQYIAAAILGDPAIPCKVQHVVDPDGVVWLVSAGRCNHAGEVGSKVQAHLVAADYSLTDDYDDRYRGGTVDGNSFTYGIENIAASSMNAKQRASSVKICAAIARHYGWTGQEAVGHGEISSARVKADPNLDMGKFRRDVMAAVKGVSSTPAPAPAPTPKPTAGLDVETITANLAGYDTVGRGERTRVARARTDIPDYLLPKQPLWFHFQECAIDMVPELDKKLKGYTRVGAGGKGRESYHRAGEVTVLEAVLVNVSHMLAKDTKEMLVIAWEKDGHQGVDVNFHSENEGVVVQPLQLRDAMTAGRKMADKHGIDRRNILITGDSNFKGAAAFAKAAGWSEVIYTAVKKIDLQWRSTNGWVMNLVTDKRIDVDVVQKDAVVLEAEQLFGALIADHWPHRVLRRLFK